MRDWDSTAVNASDCGHEYTRSNDVAVSRSTASATSCRAKPMPLKSTCSAGQYGAIQEIAHARLRRGMEK
ncbi:hypothetical protein WSS_A40460 [Rhodococcus opacus M213]|uniref:Uncharacterized protein n=1 Tax=Rhodococcus opacus M213 TaxID=1129896 RepID=K8X5R1_RHOOP|nr:hypothetical protein WSS_A40460 [Rhodococcus opacus M213]